MAVLESEKHKDSAFFWPSSSESMEKIQHFLITKLKVYMYSW